MSGSGISKTRSLALLLLFAAVSLFSAEPDQKLPLRVLYVGSPGGERAADFVGFLKKHCKQVDTADLKQLQLRAPLDADVVLLDYDGDGFKAPRVSFPEEYSQPTITIGVAGAMIGSQNRLKTGYL